MLCTHPQHLNLAADDSVDLPRSIRIQRNCSASPKTLLTVLGSLSAVSLAIGLGFWMMNAPWVLFFSGVEVLVVAVAFGVHARSVADSDTLELTAYDVRITQERAGRTQIHIFNRSMVRVGMSAELNPLVTLSSAGKTAAFGLGLRPAVRRAVCRQLQKDLTNRPASQCVQNLQGLLAQAGARIVVQYCKSPTK